MPSLTNVMLFTGAPSPSSVNDASCTIESFEASLSSFLGLDTDFKSPSQTGSSHALWRSIPLARRPFRHGLAQLHRFEDPFVRPDNDFFNTYDGLSRTADDPSLQDEEALTQFCEQSLALHNSMPPSSSQLEGGADRSMTTTTTTSITETSFMTDTFAASEPDSVLPPPPPNVAHLSHLGDIPPARQITRAGRSQLKVVNLIVGVISIAQPRTVSTRWGTRLSLVEVLVGDETSCGFGVTFWLSRDAGRLQGAVTALRRQDVVLLRNVSLNVFRNKVYGQSLRRGLTEISLLWRRDGGGHYSTRDLSGDQASRYLLTEKAKVVKNWVVQFVEGDRSNKPRGGGKSWDEPPDDTQ